MKYEVILFDADETLFDFEKSESDALKNTMSDFGINYIEDYHLKVYKEVNKIIWKELEEGLITQKELKTERFKRYADALKISFDENQFAKKYMKYLSLASFLYEDSQALIEALYTNYKLVIITNGLKDVQDNRIRRSIIGKYFDAVIISEEVELSKPDPKIFELALSSISHTDKRNVLMVGDSLTSDIQGGINYGIATCWFNEKKAENRTNIKPDYQISSIMELLTLLKD